MDTGAVPVDQNSMLKENENTLHASNVHEKTDSSMNEESAIKDYGEETTDAESPPDNQHIPSTNMNPQLKQSPPLEIQDASFLVKSYDQIPVLEQTKLPRGGISVETAAVGRVQVSPLRKNLHEKASISFLFSRFLYFFLRRLLVWNPTRNHQGQYESWNTSSTNIHRAC
jgi:hypothetical protein